METNERVAVVTGASRGVGKGIALALGAAGWTVHVTGRSAGALAETAAAVTARGGRGVAVPCDHRDDAAVLRLFDGLDRLDLLVNNAWAAPADFAWDVPFWERPLSDWEPLIGVGLRAHFVASVAACKIMVPAGRGLVVNISSFGGRAHLHSVLYGVSKAGLDKMAADMAAELAREYGIAEFDGRRPASHREVFGGPLL